MATTRRPRRWRWGSFVLMIVFLALAAVAIIFIQQPIDTHHVSDQPAPGAVQLPPTPTAIPATATGTSSP